MSESSPGRIHPEKYIEAITNIDNVEITLILVTGLVELNNTDINQKYPQLHYHDCYEAFYINDGTMTFKFENESITYSKNDLIIISPNVNHTVIKNNATNKYQERILFYIRKNLLKNAYNLYERLSAVLNKPCLHLKVNSHMGDIFKELRASLSNKDKLISSFNFHKIIVEILKVTDNADKKNTNHFMPDTTSSRVHKLHMIILKYYASDISLEYIAESLNLSTRQVSRFIKQHYGCTYRELICKMRMKTALELIMSSKLTITEIAMEVGFKSTKSFYNAFKSYYGCLPTKFRKNT